MTARLLSVGVIALVFGTYATAGGQTPPRDPRPQPAGRQIPVGTAVISGVVLSADTGLPIRNARVTLSGTAGVIPAGRGVAPPTASAPQPPTLSVSRVVATDAQGQFSFARLAQGRYSVSVSRDGYLAASFGQRRPNTSFPAIELADGELRVVPISLSRGGVIGGVVVDEYGEPARNAQVQLWRIDSTIGVKRLQQTNGISTNDRGAYRFFGLSPGSYVVSVLPRQNEMGPDAMLADMAAVEQAIATGRVQTPASGPAYVLAPPPQPPTTRVAGPSYLPVYFPGTFSPTTAQVITITGSEERDGVDMTMALARAAIIRGTISPPAPEGTSITVTLVGAEALIGNTPSTSVDQTNGTFMMNNVPPGRYTLLVQTRVGSRTIDSARVLVDGKPLDAGLRLMVNGFQQPNADAERRLWAQTQVVVSEDVPLDVVLSLRPALSLSGTVVFDMTQMPALQAGQSQVNLSPVPGSQNLPSMQGAVTPDGTFTIKGVMPGRYFLRAPWTMRSATLSGRDLLELPIEVSGEKDVTGVEITVTDKTTEVTGTLTDASGNPLGNRLVIIAPVDQQQWIPGSRRILTATTGPYGRYTFRLPAGDYVVGPVDDLENGGQYDPQVLTSLSTSGSKVTVTEGGSVQRDFRVR